MSSMHSTLAQYVGSCMIISMSPMMSLGPADVTGNSRCRISVSMATYPYSFLCLRLSMTDRGRLGSSFFVLLSALSEHAVFRPDDWPLAFELDFIASYCVMLERKSTITFPQPWETKNRLLQVFPCFMKRLPNWTSRGFKFSINRVLITGVRFRKRGDWFTKLTFFSHSTLWAPKDLSYNASSTSKTYVSSSAMSVVLYVKWSCDISISPKLLPDRMPRNTGPTTAARSLLWRGIGNESCGGTHAWSFFACTDAAPFRMIPKLLKKL